MVRLPRETLRPGPEDGIYRRQGRYAQTGDPTTYEIAAERISISLLGGGYIEVIGARDIEQIAPNQQSSHFDIAELVVYAPAL